MQASNLNNRALSLYDLGKVEEAKQAREQALQTDPQHLETTYNRGVVLWQQGEMTDDMLIHQLEMVQADSRESWRASYLLTQVHMEWGAVENALILLEKTSDLALTEPDVQALFKLAQSKNVSVRRTIRGFIAPLMWEVIR